MSQESHTLSPSQRPGLAMITGLPTLSIIVPAYNSLSALYTCLGMLVQTVDLSRTEILVQDDASPEYNLIQLPLMPGVKPQRNAVNLGFAGNINTAAQRAKGDYILMLNQDTRSLTLPDDAPVVKELLHPGWADAMLRVFIERDNVGIVGPRLVFPNGAVQSVGGLYDAGKGPFHKYLGWSNPLDRRISVTEKVSWITGAAIMIKREDFFAVGGLRGDLYPGGYFEDVDLCQTVKRQLGKDVWYCADATLVHTVASTGGNPKHFMRNSVEFHKRWNDTISADTNIVYVSY